MKKNKKDDKKKVLIAVVIVLIVLLGWYLLQQDRNGPETVTDEVTEPLPPASEPARTPARPSAPPANEPAVDPEEPIVAPPVALQDSDDEVRAAASDLAPRLTKWITPQEQVRKLVLLVDLAASGRVPVKNRPLNYPAGRFQVVTEDGVTYMDDANYARAAELVDTITAIPPEQLVRYYQSWRPLLNEAYAELGRQQSFDERLQKAIEQVLETEPLAGNVELQQPSVHYTYADPQLESASEISKFLWRMGPENTKQLQAYLRELQPLL